MDLQPYLFWAVAILTGGCAIGVVVTQNIVRCATWLLFALSGTAGMFFLLGADFVGATQLIVYVGGTLVLVVFGVMLTAQGPFISMKTGAAEWALSVVVGVLLYAVISVAILQSNWGTALEKPMPALDAATSRNSEVLGSAMLGVTNATPEGKITGVPGDKPPARKRVAYLLPFEIVSVHLLVVLIGAAYLARAKRRRGTAA
jgi:NADH-quinone oxidoreductase subunit J